MTNWQIQIHVVLTKNHTSSECCSQITTIIIHIQGKENKESVGEKIFKWYLWYAKYHIQCIFRETEVALDHPSLFMYSELNMHPAMGTCPSHTYLQISAGIHRVSLCEHQLAPRKIKFLPYQGCIFLVSNKLQNAICPALIISNAIYFLISELLMASK